MTKRPLSSLQTRILEVAVAVPHPASDFAPNRGASREAPLFLTALVLPASFVALERRRRAARRHIATAIGEAVRLRNRPAEALHAWQRVLERVLAARRLEGVN